MMSCIKKSSMVKTWQDKYFKPITEQIKRKYTDKMITFFVSHQTEILTQKYGVDDRIEGLNS